MATINLYLDCRSPRKDGRSAVKISINHRDGNRLVGLGLHLLPSEWDAARQEANASHPFQRKMNLALRRYRLAAEEALLAAEMEGAGLNEAVSAVKGAVCPGRKGEERREKGVLLAEVARRFASLKSEAGTRLTYERTIRHLERFRPEARLDDVTAGWLAEFDRHMSTTAPSPNARAIHMRNLRAVFNFAIDEGLTSNYPFRRYRIRTVVTAKRNLRVEDLRRLFAMDVEDWQEQYRDFFLLSFLLIGINPKDLLSLPAGADGGGRIEFLRAKTKRRYSIRVEPEAQALIDRMRGQDHLIGVMDGRSDYLQYVRQCNHALQLIGTRSRKGRKPEGSAAFPELTMYWARHSWATVARSIGISIDDIALALGHGDGHDLTHVYLEEDLAKVDEANRRVIDWVLHGK